MFNVLKQDGCWTIGRSYDGKYRVEIKHFDLPSERGIRKGRISTLWIAEILGEGRYKSVCYFEDERWKKSPKSGEARAIRDEAIKRYN